MLASAFCKPYMFQSLPRLPSYTGVRMDTDFGGQCVSSLEGTPTARCQKPEYMLSLRRRLYDGNQRGCPLESLEAVIGRPLSFLFGVPWGRFPLTGITVGMA